MAAIGDASRFYVKGGKGLSPLVAAMGSSYNGVFSVKDEAGCNPGSQSHPPGYDLILS
ncbi:MAG: hypothetical protein PVG22_09735 [Chromatiales bacterium]|jgi:hypothetical protein